MYSVSNDFLTAMLKPVIQSALSGTVDGIAFTEADVLQGSVRLFGQNSQQDSIDVGTATARELHITFMHSLNLTRSTLRGKQIVLTYALLVNGSYETVPLGTYYIEAANWTLKGIEVTAYDTMSLFDSVIDDDQEEYPVSGKIYDYLSWVCSECGVTIGMTQVECEALPNGTTIVDYVPGGAETHREYVAYLAAVCGGYAIIDRSDRLVIKLYQTSTYQTYTEYNRLTGASFSDFVTRYSGFYVTDTQSGKSVLYKTTGYTGLIMDLGRNPFLQGTNKLALRNGILAELANIQYAPFSCKFNFPPIYDLGDVLKLTGGIGDDNFHVINYFSWTYNQSYSIEGYGMNPALVSATSAIEKKIQEVASYTQLNTTGIITGMNRSRVEIGEDKKVIVSMSALCSQNTTGVMSCMIPITMTTAGTVTFIQEQAYEEVRREDAYLEEGEHIITLHDFFSLPGGNTTNVRIRVLSEDGGEGYITEYESRATILAPSAEVATFDGNIELDDEAVSWLITEPTFKTDGESVVVNLVPVLQVRGTDTATVWQIPEPSIDSGITDSIRVIMHNQQFDRTLEDGETIRCLEDEAGDGTQDNRGTEEEV